MRLGVICKQNDKTKIILLQIDCRFVLSFNFLFLFLPFFVEFFSSQGVTTPSFPRQSLEFLRFNNDKIGEGKDELDSMNELREDLGTKHVSTRLSTYLVSWVPLSPSAKPPPSFLYLTVLFVSS